MILWPFKGLLFLESLCGEFRSNMIVIEQKQSRNRKQSKENRKKKERRREYLINLRMQNIKGSILNLNTN
ncbi:hypothetical protein Hanom_Chr04g00344001 [Helianthus anomalus]